ncbi:MAG: carbamoyltransferase HypF [Syntrophobacteraceae bacterium]
MNQVVEDKFPRPDSDRPDPDRADQAPRDGRRVLVKVRGIVQGVGFRPFIYQLALRHGLGGWVRNREDGVEIEISGPAGTVEAFIGDISAKAPPLSRIVSVDVAELPFAPLEGFQIVKSGSRRSRSTLISPDVCTCADCLRELLDPANRRFRYPFTNCTNCGPRYTIIKDIPYDRDKTTMARFPMCPECAAEYEDPLDRRFHAQPNACAVCGPRVWLEDAGGKIISERDDAVEKAVALLDSGAILAVKGLGGFHLAVKATDEAAVARLRGRKIREEKPFAVMFSSMDEIRRHCLADEAEEALLVGSSRPIVLLSRRADVVGGPAMAEGVAPKNRFLGAFLPYTPLHFLLFEGAPYKALVMTSGNQSDEPIVMENTDARDHLRGIADYFLLHDRDIYMRCDDSVTRVLAGKPRPMRRARGYVPVPVFLKDAGPSVLGTGAELKNSVCLTRGNEAFLSQHIGDLENLETLRSFEHTIRHLERILDIRPELIVHDLHPDYLSTQWALGRERPPRLAVQHHHAHIAAVMAERGLDGPVIGLALDGTGYGTDGTIWGGEVLEVDGAGFSRLGHFRHVLLPGGAKAIKEPWRMALSYLWSIDPENIDTRFADLFATRPAGERKIILQMLARGLNSPVTSSCGRLFDAVAALCGIRDTVSYEGQAAIELEQAIEPDAGYYEGKITRRDGEAFIVDPFEMVEAVVDDVRRDLPVGIISARFHNGMVRLLAEAARVAAEISGIKTIALSGGVFQNAYLSERLEKELSGLGLDVYAHVEVPANDACIALGQAFIGLRKLVAES